MLETARKAIFFVAAFPAVLRAALRLRRLQPNRPFDELAQSLRTVSPFRLAFLANPSRLAGCVELLGGSRSCLRRSLLLLDLWSRCGLEPRLHLGLVGAAEARHFHAWVTAESLVPTAPTHHREIWSG